MKYKVTFFHPNHPLRVIAQLLDTADQSRRWVKLVEKNGYKVKRTTEVAG